MTFDKLYTSLMEAYEEDAEFGDKIRLKTDQLIFEYGKIGPLLEFRGPIHLFDPQDGAGGWDPFEYSVANKTYEKWLAKNKNKLPNNFFSGVGWLIYFMPKSPEIVNIVSEDLRGEELQEAISKKFPVYGVAETKEAYRLIVGDGDYQRLPENTIASASYDYSFHAGEGVVNSWIMSIGKDKAEVDKNIKKALSTLKAEYVGSETELKFRQKYAIGR